MNVILKIRLILKYKGKYIELNSLYGSKWGTLGSVTDTFP